MKYFFALVFTAFFCFHVDAQTREWKDTTGNFTFKADLIAHDDTSIVLQREDKELLIVDVKDLCEEDREFLDENLERLGNKQTFTMSNGMDVAGHVVEYGQREVVLKRYYGRLYVNDKLFKNLPEIYRRVVPKIVSHFDGKEFESDKELTKWIGKQDGNKKSYSVDGVMFQLENGDRYGIPLFLFSDRHQAELKPGFDKWLAAEKETQYRKDLSLQMKTRYAKKQKQEQSQMQMQRLSLQLQAFDSGLYDLWEVEMLPRGTQPGFGRRVVVPGRDSRQATQAAQKKFPGYSVGRVKKVQRRR